MTEPDTTSTTRTTETSVGAPLEVWLGSRPSVPRRWGTDTSDLFSFVLSVTPTPERRKTHVPMTVSVQVSFGKIGWCYIDNGVHLLWGFYDNHVCFSPCFSLGSGGPVRRKQVLNLNLPETRHFRSTSPEWQHIVGVFCLLVSSENDWRISNENVKTVSSNVKGDLSTVL